MTVEWQDWSAILELKARYCRFLDTKQWDKWADCFTEDYELDVSEESGMPPIQGRETALAAVRGFIESAVTVHQVHTPEITVNGNEADVIWPMQDRVVMPEGASITGFGHYHEHLVKQDDGQWRIAKLRLARLHLDIQPAAQGAK